MIYCLVIIDEKGDLYYISTINGTSFEVVAEKKVNKNNVLLLTQQRALIYANDICTNTNYNIMIKPVKS